MGNAELYHYGVKGMKWGVRRSPSQLGHKTVRTKKTAKVGLFGFGKKKTTPTKKQVELETKKKTAKDMSDQELRDAISRLKLEEEYKRLNPQQVSSGKKFTDRIINNIIIPAAEDTTKQLVKSYMTKAVNKAFDLDDELKVYTNNKKK